MPPHSTLPGRSDARRPRSTRLGLEALEDRMLLASSLAPAFANDHILVQYQNHSAPVALSGTQLGSQIGSVEGLYEVKLDAGTSVESALANYRADSRVRHAEIDHLLTPAATPNDPRYSEQWALTGSSRNIRASSGWDRTTGSSKITVSIMDTGIDYTHPDLYLNVWINQGEIPAAIKSRLIDINADGLFTFRDLNDARNKGTGKAIDVNRNGRIDGGDLLAPTSQGGWADNLDTDSNKYKDDLIGWDFADNDNNPYDDNGHGTHVSGTIGATGNNGVGVTGINWDVQLMPIRFIAPNGGSASQFIAGLSYAVNKGAKISNNSWTGAANSDLLVNAVAAARDKGHLFVAAAGNNSSNNDIAPMYPANLNLANVVTVAASDRTGALTSISNYGVRTVDLAAPGHEILGTFTGGGYAHMSGTSMATPHVAGVAALVWAKNPTWTYDKVLSQILSTAEKSSALVGKVTTGGIVSAAGALGVVQSAGTVAAPKIVSSVAMGPNSTSLSSIRVTFDRAMNLATFTAADAKLTLPNGTVISATNVKDAGNGGKTFDIIVPLQTVPGAYKLAVGPSVADLSGVNMVAFSNTYTLPWILPVPALGPKIVTSAAFGPSSSTLNGVRVTFDKAVQLATFTTADAVLTGPTGAIIPITSVKVVAGTGDKTFDVLFATQSASGKYTLKIGPNVKDLAGTNMTVYQGTYSINAVKTYTSTTKAAILPAGRAVTLLTINDAVSIADLNVKVNVTFPKLNDLFIHLQGPDGSDIALFKHFGGTAANLVNTVFDDEASTHAALGRAPYTGSYQPLVALAGMDGKLAKGTWKLWVENRGTQTGQLVDWSLIVTPKAG